MNQHPAPDMTDAACLGYDTEQFFVEGLGAAHANREAKGVCNGRPEYDIPPCPVREACLAWALELEGALTGANRYGVVGGMTAMERAKFAREGIAPRKRGKRAAA